MKIRAKLILGFSLLLVILVSITLFGYERLTGMDQRMNDFYDNRFQKTMSAVGIRNHVNTSAKSALCARISSIAPAPKQVQSRARRL